tara:strand:- start:1549 stop:2172 length:624 start_codon:yes stop_codon:yes gene_type:complete
MNSYLLIILLFFLFIFCHNKQENYKNMNIQTYEKNQPRKNKPDSKQFYACRQEVESSPGYPFERYPNSNYRIKLNEVNAPLKGAFSAFLDVHKIRNYDHFYHSPICEDDPGKESYDFNTNIDSAFRLIPGAFPEEDINEIYSEELEKDSHDLRNPYYIYSDPEYIQNKIIYDDKIQDIFLRIKLQQPKHHEDDRHLIHDHQYDGTHD